jgi:hypothetical protein
MKLLKALILSLFCSVGGVGYAQATYQEFEVGNISTRVYADGWLFNDFHYQKAKYDIPKNSGISAIYMSGLWIGGYIDLKIPNQPNILRLSKMYNSINSFKQGPILLQNRTGADPSYWNKTWIINKSVVLKHIQSFQNKSYDIPTEILNWPAHGRNGTAEILAPFIDINGNSIYEPEKGDYPDMKGDKAIYFICNDAGQGSSNDGLVLEIHGMLYGFNSNDERINNTTFLNLKILNRSTFDYRNVYFGMYNDFDLGDPTDDYIGTDSALDMVYSYNGDTQDGPSKGIPSYGDSPPAIGMVLLNKKLSNSMYFDLDDEQRGVPQTNEQYFNYLQSIFKDGTDLMYGGDGHYKSIGATNQGAHFVFPGDPNHQTVSSWTESNNFAIPNEPSDRRIIAAHHQSSFNQNDFIEIDLAYIFAENSKNDGTNTQAVAELKTLAKDIKILYDSGEFSKPTPPVIPTPNSPISGIYPNPLSIDESIIIADDLVSNVSVYSVNGVKVLEKEKGDSEIQISHSELSSGLYIIRLTTPFSSKSEKLIVK